MALQMSFVHSSGYVFPEAYFKVNFITEQDGLLLLAAEIFPNFTMREANRCLLDTYVNMVPDNPDNPDKAAVIYEYLKTQPMFAGAIDV